MSVELMLKYEWSLNFSDVWHETCQLGCLLTSLLFMRPERSAAACVSYTSTATILAAHYFPDPPTGTTILSVCVHWK